jgi:hypothetical protein
METNDVTVYKVNKSTMWGGLFILVIIFFGLTLPLLIGGSPISTEKLVGLIGFSIMGILLIVVPLCFRMEIDKDSVKAYFLNFQIRDLRPSNIQSLEYTNLMGWGVLPFGKGLRGWEKTKTGGRKYFSIGEGAYGKVAIEHAQRILEQ